MERRSMGVEVRRVVWHQSGLRLQEILGAIGMWGLGCRVTCLI